MHEPTISENTKLRLGLLVSILALVMGGLVTGVWWAATINSKVNTILEYNNYTKEAVKEHGQSISSLEKADQKHDLRQSVLESRVTALEAKSSNGSTR